MLSRPATTAPGATLLRARWVPAVRLPLVLLAALVLALLGAAPASAHAQFTGADPAEGAQLGELPATLVMSYSEEIAPQFVETAVVTPDGTTLPTPATAAGLDVTVDLGGADVAAAADQAGTWQVVARVVSVDGHPVEQETTFVLAEPSEPPPAPSSAASTAATGEATAATPGDPADGATEPATSEAEATALATAPTASPTDGLPRWAAVVGAVVLVLAAAAALLVQLRRRPPTG